MKRHVVKTPFEAFVDAIKLKFVIEHQCKKITSAKSAGLIMEVEVEVEVHAGPELPNTQMWSGGEKNLMTELSHRASHMRLMRSDVMQILQNYVS